MMQAMWEGKQGRLSHDGDSGPRVARVTRSTGASSEPANALAFSVESLAPDSARWALDASP